MDKEFTVGNYLNAHTQLAKTLNHDEINFGINLIKEKFLSGKQIFTCGNGGSASTASHYITDWNKMIRLATGKKFKGISLCDNLGLITAYANDFSYAEIFSGQLKGLMESGDLLIAISGSGNSQNVLQAVECAHQIGGETLAVVGYDGGKLKQVAQNSVLVKSFDMQLCEDVHLMFGHMVMKSLCNSYIVNSA
jgi:D-sedoheptulose 7-phosphate isomerase